MVDKGIVELIDEVIIELLLGASLAIRLKLEHLWFKLAALLELAARSSFGFGLVFNDSRRKLPAVFRLLCIGT
jgi:hypothetical protein